MVLSRMVVKIVVDVVITSKDGGVLDVAGDGAADGWTQRNKDGKAFIVDDVMVVNVIVHVVINVNTILDFIIVFVVDNFLFGANDCRACRMLDGAEEGVTNGLVDGTNNGLSAC